MTSGNTLPACQGISDRPAINSWYRPHNAEGMAADRAQAPNSRAGSTQRQYHTQQLPQSGTPAPIETQERPPQPSVMGVRTPVGYLKQELGFELRHEPATTNPPFRTPLGMWFKRSKAESFISDILNSEHINSLTDAEIFEMQRDLEDSRNTPVPTSLPQTNIFFCLLDKVDGLFFREHARLGVSIKVGGFIVQHPTPGSGLATELLIEPSSTLEEYFCGPDAGFSEKLYDRYISLAAVFSTDKWQSPAGIEDLHQAAQNMLHKFKLENRHILSSSDKPTLLTYFREQVDKIEALLERYLLEMLDSEADKKRAGLRDAKTIFAHIAALKHAYENNADPICASKAVTGTAISFAGVLRKTLVVTTYLRHPRFVNRNSPGQNPYLVSEGSASRSPFWGTAKPRQQGPNPADNSHKKTVHFSNSIANIPVILPGPETTALPLDPPLIPMGDASTKGGKLHYIDTDDDTSNMNPLNPSKTNTPEFSLAHPIFQAPASRGSPSPAEDVEQTNTEIDSDTNDSEDLPSRTRGSGSLFDTRSSDTGGHVAAETRDWLKSYTSRTLALLKGRRKKDDSRVRIAVLDTGIDLEHPKLAKSKTRIVAHRSWVANDPFTGDICGHGTHIASIFLKMAPWAHLYVARVFKDEEDVSESGVSAIVEAIHHARTEWEVDIISMSFGYRKYKPQIEAAIKKCVEAKPPILIFAAAANTGAREDRPAFPARMNSVFCINSASGDGQASTYNPPMGPRDDNLTFLGESIAGAWPVALEGAPQRILSGTSFAVPVAASIAALVLEFCQQRPPLPELSEHCVARIHSYEGMREVFRETMAGKDVDRHVLIQPWRLFDARVEHDLEKERVAAASKLSAVMLNLFGE